MTIQELDTAARCGLDLLVVVMNDRGLGAEAHKLRKLGFDASGALIPTPDLVAIARAVGGDGAVVDTLDGLRSAAAEFQRSGGVRVLDVRISQRVLSGPYAKKFTLPEPARVDRELGNGVELGAPT
jgi:acetolactate synthase-1/2/3 large subunit